MKKLGALSSAIVGIISAVVLPLSVYAASPMVVNPTSMNGWQEKSLATASGSFVTGPGTPPLGKGSYQMLTGGGSNTNGGKQFIFNPELFNQKLSEVTTLSYSTYITSRADGTVVAPAININAVINGTWTTLVYEPAYNSDNNVPLTTWTTWNTLEGKWWSTKDLYTDTSHTIVAVHAFTDYVTWPTIENLDTNATISGDGDTQVGGIQIVVGQKSAGMPWENFNGNIDNVTINTVTYDFEPALTYPATKDDCKGDNWKTFTGQQFKNQGDCVSYVASKQKSKGNPVVNFFKSIF